MPEVRIVAKNFMDMVASMPAMKLDKLYENGFICDAILRSLPPLAKKYVVQLLHIDGPVSAKLLEDCVLPDGLSKHKVSIDRLVQLRLFIEAVDRVENAEVLCLGLVSVAVFMPVLPLFRATGGILLQMAPPSIPPTVVMVMVYKYYIDVILRF